MPRALHSERSFGLAGPWLGGGPGLAGPRYSSAAGLFGCVGGGPEAAVGLIRAGAVGGGTRDARAADAGLPPVACRAAAFSPLAFPEPRKHGPAPAVLAKNRSFFLIVIVKAMVKRSTLGAVPASLLLLLLSAD